MTGTLWITRIFTAVLSIEVFGNGDSSTKRPRCHSKRSASTNTPANLIGERKQTIIEFKPNERERESERWKWRDVDTDDDDDDDDDDELTIGKIV